MSTGSRFFSLCSAVAFGRPHGVLPDLFSHQSRRRRRHHRLGDGPLRVYAHPKGRAFAAVKHDGAVVTWGFEAFGGNSDKVKSELSGCVDHVVGTLYAFVEVLKQKGQRRSGGDLTREREIYRCPRSECRSEGRHCFAGNSRDARLQARHRPQANDRPMPSDRPAPGPRCHRRPRYRQPSRGRGRRRRHQSILCS